jgi:trk system potassium uptake protein TrkA
MIACQYTIIVGCGRLGSILANQLSRLGGNVVVVDRDEAAFKNLSVEFSGFQVTGDAAELAVLRRAGIEKADCLLATTRHDNVNLMVAQVARTVFGLSKVIARVFDPSRQAVYDQFEIETVCPTLLSADIFLETLGQGPEAVES